MARKDVDVKKFCLLVFFLLFSLPAFSASIEIENYTPNELKTSLLKYFIQQGATVENLTDYSIVVKSTNNSFLFNFIYGSSFNCYAQIKTNFTFVKNGNNTIMSASSSIVTNPDSAFVTSVPINESKVYVALDNLHKELCGYYGYGIGYRKYRNFIEITSLDYSSNNSKKLNLGEKIYFIDDIPVKKLNKFDIENKFSNDEIKIKIRDYNNSYREFTLKREYIKPKINKERI